MIEVIDNASFTSNSAMGFRQLGRLGFVIHTTDGQNSIATLQGSPDKQGNQVSSDFFIDRTGSIHRLVAKERYAYHVGTSSLHNSTNEGLRINEQYYGIECENYDRAGECCTDRQYQSTAVVIRALSAIDNLSPPNIYAHGNIALPFGRRSDPVRYNYGLMFHYSTYPTLEMIVAENALKSLYK